MEAARLSVSIVLVVLLAGCSRWTLSGPVVTGPHPRLGQATFAEVVEVARAQGYAPFDVSPEGGTFRVRSRWTSDSGEHAVFLVRAYREGWLQTTVEGPIAQRRGQRLLLPKPADRELVLLGIAMGAALDQSELAR